MKDGETWYHKNTLDIALRIVKVLNATKEKTKVIAHIVNRHNGIYYETDTFALRGDQMHLWEKIK